MLQKVFYEVRNKLTQALTTVSVADGSNFKNYISRIGNSPIMESLSTYGVDIMRAKSPINLLQQI